MPGIEPGSACVCSALRLTNKTVSLPLPHSNREYGRGNKCLENSISIQMLYPLITTWKQTLLLARRSFRFRQPGANIRSYSMGLKNTFASASSETSGMLQRPNGYMAPHMQLRQPMDT